MKLEVLETKEQKLLNRKEVIIKVSFEKVTPKRDDLNKVISEHLKVAPELLKIQNIHQIFGIRQAKVISYVYHDKDSFQRVEVINKKVKKEASKKE